MHFLRILILVLLSQCNCLQDHSRLKLPQLPLVSEQGLQEDEDCSLLAQGFANCQALTGYYYYVWFGYLDLSFQRPSPAEQTLLPFVAFISTQLFYQPLFHHLPGSWPLDEWVESDRLMYAFNMWEKGTNPKQDSGKDILKKHSEWINTGRWTNLHLLLSNQKNICVNCSLLSEPCPAFLKIINKKSQEFTYMHI